MGCATLKHNVRNIAREASAAPAAKFKSDYRTSGFTRFHMYGNRVNRNVRD